MSSPPIPWARLPKICGCDLPTALRVCTTDQLFLDVSATLSPPAFPHKSRPSGFCSQKHRMSVSMLETVAGPHAVIFIKCLLDGRHFEYSLGQGQWSHLFQWTSKFSSGEGQTYRSGRKGHRKAEAKPLTLRERSSSEDTVQSDWTLMATKREGWAATEIPQRRGWKRLLPGHSSKPRSHLRTWVRIVWLRSLVGCYALEMLYSCF